MLFSVLTVYLLLIFLEPALSKVPGDDKDPFGDHLIAKLRNDANLDLSADEEYEDLRAELLAYHTALATLTSDVNNNADLKKQKEELQGADVKEVQETDVKQVPGARRSLGSTPCWDIGGICIDYKLCSGFRYLTEVPGCKDKLRVCCFTWNKYKPRDHTEYGINNLAFPWTIQTEYGGKGVVDKSDDANDDDILIDRKKKNSLANLLKKSKIVEITPKELLNIERRHGGKTWAIIIDDSSPRN